jgi:hypothetical protein
MQPMQIETDHSNQTQTGQPLWLAPVLVVRAILAALLHFLGLYNRMKSYNRSTRFKPTWIDSFDDLRRLEWNRARMRALVAGALLRGENPDDLPPFQFEDTVPADFICPCPNSPLEMNRRFLSLARFRLDPHADIQRYVQRLAKREHIDLSGCPLRLASRSTSPALRAEEENHRSLSSSDAQHRGRWIAASSRRDGGGSRRLVILAQARAPPTFPRLPIADLPQREARLRSRPRVH